MTDITARIFDAAILDQKVAGQMGDKRYAYTTVWSDAGWALGIAVQGEYGYNPVVGKAFDNQEEAQAWADGLNQHIGLKPIDAVEIITSTMHRSQIDLNRWPT